MSEETLKKMPPGLLVALVTRVEPPPQYDKQMIHEPEVLPDGTEVAEWKTHKTLANKAEFDEATTVRLKVRSLVGGACIRTSFGLLCPKAQVEALDAAMAEARSLSDGFNAKSATYKVKWASIRGEIAENAAEAIAAIKVEVSGLLSEMDAAMQSGEVKRLRSLAAQANSLGPLLGQETDEGRDLLGRAVSAYRRVARSIVKKVEKEGEKLADVLHEANLEPVARARFLFEMEPMEPETALTKEEEQAVGAVQDHALAHGWQADDADQLAQALRKGLDGPNARGIRDLIGAPPQTLTTTKVAAAIIAELKSALKQFGEYAFDDKGPHEVMEIGAIRAQIDALPADEAAATLQILCDHSERGRTLAGCLLNDMEGVADDRWTVLLSRPDVAEAGGYGEPSPGVQPTVGKAISVTKLVDKMKGDMAARAAKQGGAK